LPRGRAVLAVLSRPRVGRPTGRWPGRRWWRPRAGAVGRFQAPRRLLLCQPTVA
jgi:hypothetical protein